MTSSRQHRFPLGREITLDELARDPYPIYARLRAREPITWVPALDMWLVVGYEDVRAALLECPHLTTASPRSTIFDTFGAQMLSTEGELHDRYRNAARRAFTPNFVREHLEPAIAASARRLVTGFESNGWADLREAFAARLPIQVMLGLCGLPQEDEARMRGWYDDFEAALANFSGDPAIREAAGRSVGEFNARLDEAIGSVSPSAADHSLLAQLTLAPAAERLSDEEIKRNLSIIFFGGISTVEALLLNTVWALFVHGHALGRVKGERAMLPQAIEETMRWMSPVQSATRHVTEAFEWRGLEFAPHETVNCMLGAANRDPSVFPLPDQFDLDRGNARRHLGFATGMHACLGSHLAKTEARIGLNALLDALGDMRLDGARSEAPAGYEFRQPRRLSVTWDPAKPLS